MEDCGLSLLADVFFEVVEWKTVASDCMLLHLLRWWRGRLWHLRLLAD